MKFTHLLAALLLACSTTAYTQTTAQNDAVLVVDEGEPMPDSAQLIDNIKVGGSFRSDCGYMQAMAHAKNKARDKGGNVLKITDIKFPEGFASCVRIKADVYYAPHVAELARAKDRAMDSLLDHLVPDTAQYAVLYVYRQRGSTGSLVSYNLHVDDSDVCRVANGTRFAIKVYKTGESDIWARTESRKTVTLHVKPGKAYFLKCSVKMGVVVGEPEFDVVDSYEGYTEYTKGSYFDNKDMNSKKPGKGKDYMDD